MSADIHTIYNSNSRDHVATLRKIANQIEAGDYGEVGCVGLVLLGDRMEVFGMGADSDAPSVGLLLHAGFSLMSDAIKNHGR